MGAMHKVGATNNTLLDNGENNHWLAKSGGLKPPAPYRPCGCLWTNCAPLSRFYWSTVRLHYAVHIIGLIYFDFSNAYGVAHNLVFPLHLHFYLFTFVVKQVWNRCYRRSSSLVVMIMKMMMMMATMMANHFAKIQNWGSC